MIKTIQTKIWLGLITMMLLISIMVGMSWMNFNAVKRDIAITQTEVQPRYVRSLEFSTALYKAVAAMGHYLLSQSIQDKTTSEQDWKIIDQLIIDLRDIVSADEKIQVDQIAQQVKQLKAYRTRLRQLVTQPLENYPAMKIAAESLEPLGQQMLQLTTDMLLEQENDHSDLLLTLHNLRYNWSSVQGGIRHFLAFKTTASIDEVSLFLKGVTQIVAQLNAETNLSEEQEDALEEFIDYQAQYIKVMNTLINTHQSEQWRQDSLLIRTRVGPHLKTIEQTLKAFIALQASAIEQSNHALTAKADQSTTTLIFLLVVAMAVVLVMSLLSCQHLIRPVVTLRDLLKDIAQGQGDLTQRIQVKGQDEIAQTSTHFNATMESLRSMLQQVVSAFSAVSDNAHKVDALRRAISANSEKEEILIKQTAVAGHDIDQVCQSIRSSTEETVSALSHAVESITQGIDNMGAMSSRTQHMLTQLAALQTAIDELNSKGQTMKDMVSMITSIAEQTNLLALNAAIEAARAGDYGRGFSVVADEVRHLSSKTQETTVDISKSIDGYFRFNQHLVKQMHEISSTATTLSDSVHSSENSMNDIKENVNTIEQITHGIVQSAQTQSQKATQIREITQNSTQLSEDTQHLVTDIEDKMQDLLTLTQTVSGLLGHFKV